MVLFGQGDDCNVIERRDVTFLKCNSCQVLKKNVLFSPFKLKSNDHLGVT